MHSSAASLKKRLTKIPLKALSVLLVSWVVFFYWPVTGNTSSTVYSEDKRFIDNGNGTISDTKTGLMWMKEDSYLRTGHWLNWLEAFDFVKQLNKERFADHIDWQMPTIEQLKTLYEAEKYNSSQVGREMNIHMDPIFARDGCGSSWAVEANGSYNAFGVVFNTGNRFSSPKKSRSRRAVRAVRYTTP